jgi:hypothetical protein
VREAAVQTLRKLAPEELARHAPAVAAKLEDSDGGVREAARQVLSNLQSAAV